MEQLLQPQNTLFCDLGLMDEISCPQEIYYLQQILKQLSTHSLCSRRPFMYK